MSARMEFKRRGVRDEYRMRRLTRCLAEARLIAEKPRRIQELRELRDLLGVSQRTIERDIRDLNLAGYPVRDLRPGLVYAGKDFGEQARAARGG